MNEAQQPESQSCVQAEKSGYDARRARYEKTEKAKERRRRYREQIKAQRREARRITRQIKWAHRTLGVVCHSADPTARAIQLPEVAPVKTSHCDERFIKSHLQPSREELAAQKEEQVEHERLKAMSAVGVA